MAEVKMTTEERATWLEEANGALQTMIELAKDPDENASAVYSAYVKRITEAATAIGDGLVERGSCRSCSHPVIPMLMELVPWCLWCLTCARWCGIDAEFLASQMVRKNAKTISPEQRRQWLEEHKIIYQRAKEVRRAARNPYEEKVDGEKLIRLEKAFRAILINHAIPGYCIACGEAIPTGRLSAMEGTVWCIHCSRQVEETYQKESHRENFLTSRFRVSAFERRIEREEEAAEDALSSAGTPKDLQKRPEMIGAFFLFFRG